MAEGRSHELSVVVVQTLGAVAIAAITGFVTYFNTARPLNAQIDQLKDDKSGSNSTKNDQTQIELKAAKDEISSLKNKLSMPTSSLTSATQGTSELSTANAEIKSLKDQLVRQNIRYQMENGARAITERQLKEANELLDNITLTAHFSLPNEPYTYIGCMKNAKVARTKLGTQNLSEDKNLVSFNVGRSIVMISCSSTVPVYRLVIAGVETKEKLAELRNSVENILDQ